MTANSLKDGDGPRPKKKLKFKHNGCDSPLGICLQIPISKVNENSITLEERGDFVGFAIFTFTGNGTLEIAPDRNIALPDGSVPITQDMGILPETVKEFEYKFSFIKKGDYKIDYSKNLPFGIVRVKVAQ